MDVIDGKAIVKPLADIHVGEIEIELTGMAETYVARLSAIAGMNASSIASHTFLSLSQPDLHRHYPSDGVFKKGTTYEFAFTFVVPERLVDGACNHAVVDPLVRDAHLLLPPTFGDPESLGEGVSPDDISPQVTRVRYVISAKLSGVPEDSAESTSRVIAFHTQPLRIIPLLELASPSDTTGHLGISTLDISRAEKRINKGILRENVGTLVMEALEPGILHLGSPREGADPASLITVMLRFDPAQSVTRVPHVAKIVTELEVHSFFSTTPYQKFPRKDEDEFDASRGVYSKRITLASRTLSSIQWHDDDIPSRNHSRDTETVVAPGDRWIPAPTGNHKPGTTSPVARMLVPVELPTNKAVVPTFHSCFISRTYTLCISLMLPTFGLGDSVQLRLPLQVSARFPAI